MPKRGNLPLCSPLDEHGQPKATVGVIRVVDLQHPVLPPKPFINATSVVVSDEGSLESSGEYLSNGSVHSPRVRTSGESVLVANKKSECLDCLGAALVVGDIVTFQHEKKTISGCIIEILFKIAGPTKLTHAFVKLSFEHEQSVKRARALRARMTLAREVGIASRNVKRAMGDSPPATSVISVNAACADANLYCCVDSGATINLTKAHKLVNKAWRDCNVGITGVSENGAAIVATKKGLVDLVSDDGKRKISTLFYYSEAASGTYFSPPVLLEENHGLTFELGYRKGEIKLDGTNFITLPVESRVAQTTPMFWVPDKNLKPHLN